MNIHYQNLILVDWPYKFIYIVYHNLPMPQYDARAINFVYFVVTCYEHVHEKFELKYYNTIVVFSKIPVPQEKAYFPGEMYTI